MNKEKIASDVSDLINQMPDRKTLEDYKLENAKLWAIVKHKSFILKNIFGLSFEKQDLFEKELMQQIKKPDQVPDKACFMSECAGCNEGFPIDGKLADCFKLSNLSFQVPKTIMICYNSLANPKIKAIIDPDFDQLEYEKRFNGFDWEFLDDDNRWKTIRDVAI